MTTVVQQGGVLPPSEIPPEIAAKDGRLLRTLGVFAAYLPVVAFLRDGAPAELRGWITAAGLLSLPVLGLLAIRFDPLRLLEPRPKGLMKRFFRGSVVCGSCVSLGCTAFVLTSEPEPTPELDRSFGALPVTLDTIAPEHGEPSIVHISGRVQLDPSSPVEAKNVKLWGVWSGDPSRTKHSVDFDPRVATDHLVGVRARVDLLRFADSRSPFGKYDFGLTYDRSAQEPFEDSKSYELPYHQSFDGHSNRVLHGSSSWKVDGRGCLAIDVVDGRGYSRACINQSFYWPDTVRITGRATIGLPRAEPSSASAFGGLELVLGERLSFVLCDGSADAFSIKTGRERSGSGTVRTASGVTVRAPACRIVPGKPFEFALEVAFKNDRATAQLVVDGAPTHARTVDFSTRRDDPEWSLALRAWREPTRVDDVTVWLDPDHGTSKEATVAASRAPVRAARR